MLTFLLRHRLRALAAAVALAMASVVSWGAAPQITNAPVPAIRLIIEHRAGAFRLLSSSTVTKVIPPSDELPASKSPLSGFWFEVQSAGGQVKYRRIIGDPLTVYSEVPGPEGAPQPDRIEAVAEETVFTLLIPSTPGTNQLVLFSSPPGASGKAQPAQVVARIPIVSPPR